MINLTKRNMVLTKTQKRQVMKQIQGQQHNTHKIDLVLTEGHEICDLIIKKNVLNPKGVAATYLSQWLFFNSGCYYSKSVVDMGCGSGIQGIVMANYGAKKVWCSDISEESVENTKENVSQYNLDDKIKVVQGDLFENIDEKSDLIVANIPFFCEEPYPDHPISLAMLNNGTLIHRFLEESKEYLTKEGSVIMVYYEIGGEINHPFVQGPKHNFQVECRSRIDSRMEIQKGPMSIYELRLQ